MRKFSIVFIIAAFALMFTACAENLQLEEQQHTAAQPSENEQQSAPPSRDILVEEQPPEYEIAPVENYVPVGGASVDYPEISEDAEADSETLETEPPMREFAETVREPVAETENIEADDLPVSENIGGTAAPGRLLTQEEVEEIGARYISDMFGTDISGMNVYLRNHSVFNERIIWYFVVSTDASLDVNGVNLRYSYSYSIDGATGERLSIYRPPANQSFEATGGIISDEERGSVMGMWSRWDSMNLQERLGVSDLTPEAVQRYTDTAREYARRHFNGSSVADVRLDFLLPGDMTASDDGFIANIALLSFTATDNAGREIDITISSDTAADTFRGSVSVNAVF